MADGPRADARHLLEDLASITEETSRETDGGPSNEATAQSEKCVPVPQYHPPPLLNPVSAIQHNTVDACITAGAPQPKRHSLCNRSLGGEPIDHDAYTTLPTSVRPAQEVALGNVESTDNDGWSRRVLHGLKGSDDQDGAGGYDLKRSRRSQHLASCALENAVHCTSNMVKGTYKEPLGILEEVKRESDRERLAIADAKVLLPANRTPYVSSIVDLGFKNSFRAMDSEFLYPTALSSLPAGISQGLQQHRPAAVASPHDVGAIEDIVPANAHRACPTVALGVSGVSPPFPPPSFLPSSSRSLIPASSPAPNAIDHPPATQLDVLASIRFQLESISFNWKKSPPALVPRESTPRQEHTGPIFLLSSYPNAIASADSGRLKEPVGEEWGIEDGALKVHGVFNSTTVQYVEGEIDLPGKGCFDLRTRPPHRLSGRSPPGTLVACPLALPFRRFPWNRYSEEPEDSGHEDRTSNLWQKPLSDSLSGFSGSPGRLQTTMKAPKSLTFNGTVNGQAKVSQRSITSITQTSDAQSMPAFSSAKIPQQEHRNGIVSKAGKKGNLSIQPFHPSAASIDTSHGHGDVFGGMPIVELLPTQTEKFDADQGGPFNKPRAPVSSDGAILHWEKCKLIGKGAYGKVYLGRNSATNELFAVKQVEMPEPYSDHQGTHQKVLRAIKLESDTLRNLNHPNVVTYLGFEQTVDNFNIFLEYVGGGSLAQCYRRLNGGFEKEVTRHCTKQIVEGLAYLHSNGILHRDLKADNILIDFNGVCKIADFGISKRLQEDIYGANEEATALQGTVLWMAPEVIASLQGYGGKADMWSLGCVVLELGTGLRPWAPREQLNVLFMLKDEKTRQAPPFGPDLKIHLEGRDFLNQCFAINPEDRPTAEELRSHPYLIADWEFNKEAVFGSKFTVA